MTDAIRFRDLMPRVDSEQCRRQCRPAPAAISPDVSLAPAASPGAGAPRVVVRPAALAPAVTVATARSVATQVRVAAPLVLTLALASPRVSASPIRSNILHFSAIPTVTRTTSVPHGFPSISMSRELDEKDPGNRDRLICFTSMLIRRLRVRMAAANLA
jgi:hypothetical protein